MADIFDALETEAPDALEERQFGALRALLADAAARVPALAERIDPAVVATLTARDALARIPVLRKADLMEAQADDPPFGGFADPDRIDGLRVYQSPGPIWEIEDARPEAALATARAFFAAGARRGDIVHNAFGYHMTPGGFLLDAGARALGCMVLPAGSGNTEMQVEAAAHLRPGVFCGTPDFLKILLDRAAELGRDLSSFRRALVSGGALFPSLRAAYAERGVAVFQAYATAEFGVIAYETAGEDGKPLPGMVVSPHVLVEIVRPGTGDTLPDGEVGEVVVTGFNPAYPLLRLGTGDLSAVMPGPSPCGRTGMRLKGWMGRADQRTKVKGMFVDPAQVEQVRKRHPQLGRARLVVRRDGETDAMTLQVEAFGGSSDAGPIADTLRMVTGLGGAVEIVAPGSLPNDGKIIADERDYAP